MFRYFISSPNTNVTKVYLTYRDPTATLLALILHFPKLILTFQIASATSDSRLNSDILENSFNFLFTLVLERIKFLPR